MISLHAGVASTTAVSPEAREALGTIRSASRGALRDISALLTHLGADEDGRELSPQPTLRSLDTLLQGTDATIKGDLSRVSGVADSEGYRIVQEAVTNAHKQGRGTPQVLVDVGDDLTISVTNTIGERTPGAGLGLIGVRVRLSVLGGHLEAARHEEIFVFTATIPLKEPA